MKPIALDEVLDIAGYEKARPDFRPQVLAAKELRRVTAGPHVTLLFENRLTVLYQIQEMMRVERMVSDAAIRHEVETYNELIPAQGELSATLMIGYESEAERTVKLVELLGLDHHLWLAVGGLPRIPAWFDRRQIGEDRVSAVQFIRFSLPADHRDQWLAAAETGGVAVVLDHPAYSHTEKLALPAARALFEDFSAG